MAKKTARLRDFIGDLAALVARTDDEPTLLRDGGALLKTLVSHDDWLPDEFAVPDPERYRQYLLHCDGAERFSVASFVWGPGQQTPVHNHTVWGLVGLMRGGELSQRFELGTNGLVELGRPGRLAPGDVEAVSPSVGDIHRVTNAYDDRVSISIHVYGANVGAVRRSTFAADGTAKEFISGYANAVLPNIWDRSKAS